MLQPVLFYSWQSDLPRASTRDIVRKATVAALGHVGHYMPLQDAPRMDEDTKNEAGTPAISETIFRKIRESAIVIADVTFVGQTFEQPGHERKRLPNPNVLIELGYAADALGWDRIILVMNKHYGSPESLPFDLRYRRFPLTFNSGRNRPAGKPSPTNSLATLQPPCGHAWPPSTTG